MAFSISTRSVPHSASITSKRSPSLITPSEAAMSGLLRISSRSLLSFFFCVAWPPFRRRLADEDVLEEDFVLFELFFGDLPTKEGLDDLPLLLLNNAPLLSLPLLLLINAPLLFLLFFDCLLLPLDLLAEAVLLSMRPTLSGETDVSSADSGDPNTSFPSETLA
eukprot:CAMPEP_0181049358 /NCGR_PEP_ID=MMETSP1070-20121207/15935_1 /TAXON_ID=265543 /ORGANISM="Minutocellus polymorphus, Strain NH13" /LENGTH=163 /DNA_ID=CAMNT_0023128221 /DNA_START=93 /DNA_END=584 /DNA_ORIENTATION=+